MKKTLIYLAAIAILGGCRGKGSGDNLTREQQQYDVVQEGQTSTAVTSTISAPGEVIPPAMTNTNVDTTSNFTLPGVAPATATTSQPPGTLAGTMTVPSNSGSLIGYTPAPAPPRQRPSRPASTSTATHTETTSTTSTTLEGPPPSTSTIPPTTDTAPPPPPRDDQKPPSTDTQPPPTTTTTGLGPTALL